MIRRIYFTTLMICLLTLFGCGEKTMNTTNVLETPLLEQPTINQQLKAGEFSLLDYRLIVNMPENSQNEPIQESVMSAPESEQNQTRLMLNEGAETSVLMAYELFQKSTGNLEDDARLMLSEESYIIGDISANGEIKVLEITPKLYDDTAEAIFIRSALISDEDGMLMRVDLFVNPDRFKKKDDCIKQGDDLIKSIKFGGRHITLTAHKEQTEFFNIQLSEHYIMTSQIGADFNVFKIYKTLKLGEPVSNMIIYIGEHPTETDPERYTGYDLVSTNAKVLGKSIKWNTYTNGDAKTYSSFAETLFNYRSGFKMHILIYATDENDLDEMKLIAQSMS